MHLIKEKTLIQIKVYKIDRIYKIWILTRMVQGNLIIAIIFRIKFLILNM